MVCYRFNKQPFSTVNERQNNAPPNKWWCFRFIKIWLLSWDLKQKLRNRYISGCKTSNPDVANSKVSSYTIYLKTGTLNTARIFTISVTQTRNLGYYVFRNWGFTSPGRDTSKKLIKVSAKPKLLEVFWAMLTLSTEPTSLLSLQFTERTNRNVGPLNFLVRHPSPNYQPKRSPFQLSSSWTTPKKIKLDVCPHPATHSCGNNTRVCRVPRPESWNDHPTFLSTSSLNHDLT